MRAGMALFLTFVAANALLAQAVPSGVPQSPISPLPAAPIQPAAIPGGIVPVPLSAAPQNAIVQPVSPPGAQQFQPIQQVQGQVIPQQPPGVRPAGQANLPAEDPKRPPVDPKVVAHLEGWENTMRGLNTFAVSALLTRTDLTTKRTSKFAGDIWCMKPNLARMSLRKQALPGEKLDPNDMKAYICNGKGIYEYDGLTKKLTIVPIGPNGIGSNLLLDLMSGMSARAAMARFDFTLIKQDANYIYLEVKPVLITDREEFQTMTLVLCNPGNPETKGLDYIPRMVVLRQQNGQQEEIWDFPRPIVNPKEVNEGHFKPEHPGKDWTVEEVKLPKLGQHTGAPAGGSPRIPTPGAGR